MIKGILFDKDGTLIEYHSTQHHIYATLLARLKESAMMLPPGDGAARYGVAYCRPCELSYPVGR